MTVACSKIALTGVRKVALRRPKHFGASPTCATPSSWKEPTPAPTLTRLSLNLRLSLSLGLRLGLGLRLRLSLSLSLSQPEPDGNHLRHAKQLERVLQQFRRKEACGDYTVHYIVHHRVHHRVHHTGWGFDMGRTPDPCSFSKEGRLGVASARACLRRPDTI